MNDEGRVLEENLPDVPHLQRPTASALARIAVEELESGAARPRRRVPAPPAGPRPRHRPARRPRPVRPGPALPAGPAPRAGRRRSGGPGWSCFRGPTWSTSRPAPRSAPRPSAQAGPLRWAEARHAPLDLIDAEGSSTPARRTRRTGRSARSAGSATPRASAGPWQASASSSPGFRAFPDHHPYRRRRRGRPGRLGHGRWGRSWP